MAGMDVAVIVRREEDQGETERITKTLEIKLKCYNRRKQNSEDSRKVA
jgi:hypothetical protein